MSAEAQDALLDRLFTAISDGDADTIAAVFAPDVAVWHNVTDRAVDHELSLRILRNFIRRVSGRRYEVLERRHWDGGAVQRHVLHGTIDGAPLRAPVCITFAFAGGQITRVDEYVDSRDVAALL